MVVHLYLIGFYVLCIIQCSICDICSTCSCLTTTNGGHVIDCREQNLDKNDMLNFDLLMLDRYQTFNKLILSKNNISNLPGRLLTKLKSLQSLDLSENVIENVYINIFMELNNLEELNLSKNKLTTFDDSMIKIIPTLLTLNISHNRIHTIQSIANKTLTKINILDVSHNNVSNIPNKFFESLPELRYLNLSYNRIETLADYDFTQLNSLKAIYLNNNFLTVLDMQIFPRSLLEIYCGYNNVTQVIYDFSRLQVLNIKYNNITELNTDLTKLKSLEHLQISGNLLSDFPDILLENLTTLDMSDNKFLRIPETLSSKNFPLLRDFHISKNPIRNLTFYSNLMLQSFVANNISTLETIEKDAFAKLSSSPDGCINLIISNNEMLSSIHEDALKHINVCFLDLSNNRLSYVSQKLVTRDDNYPMNGVNLQGNPFKCDCSLQWMLNNFVPKLYSTKPSLLDNLRCSWPLQMSNMRMVHWYGWEEEIYCTNATNFSEDIKMNDLNVQEDKKVTFGTSPELLIVVGIAMVVLTSLVIIGIIWANRVALKRRRANRRF